MSQEQASNANTYGYSAGRSAQLLTRVQDANLHTSFGYDDLGRQTSVTNALSQIRHTYYDAKGRISSTVNARSQTISYTYDKADRMTKKSPPEGDITYGYDAAGNLASASHHNGSGLANTYDANNRLTQQVQPLPSGHTVTIGYGYDNNGNRTSMATPSATSATPTTPTTASPASPIPTMWQLHAGRLPSS